MQPEDFIKGSKLAESFSLSNDELDLAIETTECVFAYLNARGLSWHLATRALRADLNKLHGSRSARSVQDARLESENPPKKD